MSETVLVGEINILTQNSEDVLSFWFKEINSKQWFIKDDVFDETIRLRFEPTVTAALDKQLDEWANTAEGCLALIILLDQFTRNMYRDTPRAFIGDQKALALSFLCIDRNYIKKKDRDWCHFMLMPMMHSENLGIQNKSLPLFKKLTGSRTLEYAVKHRNVIERFGRFPHRNVILGRPSTNEEVKFLAQPGSSF